MQTEILTSTDIEESNGKDPKECSSTASILVSLYLVLLAFFILLNSYATIEQKRVTDAVDSVKNTFSNLQHEEDIPTIRSVSSGGASISLNSYLAPVGSVIREAVTLVDTELVELGNTLQVTMRTNEFFYPEDRTIKAEQELFLATLADEINKVTNGSRIDMELLFGSDELEERPNAQNNLSVARAGEMARMLSNLGVDDRSIFIGISPGATTDRFTISFYLRDLETDKVAPEATMHDDGDQQPAVPDNDAIPVQPTESVTEDE